MTSSTRSSTELLIRDKGLRSSEFLHAETILQDPADAQLEQQIVSDVNASRSGDGDAFARIIRRFQPMVGRRMVRFTRRQLELQELVQDVFVEAYFSLPSYRGDAPFEHWLNSIATRVGYRFWKRRHKQTSKNISLDETLDMAAPASVSADAAAGASDVLRLLDQLPPRDRLVILLLHVEEHSVEETAQLTGWSRAMVKVQAFRARHKLKKLLAASQQGAHR